MVKPHRRNPNGQDFWSVEHLQAESVLSFSAQNNQNFESNYGYMISKDDETKIKCEHSTLFISIIGKQIFSQLRTIDYIFL